MPLQVTAKSVLNKTKNRDRFFLDDYTFNPYSGCSFNCLFCYIRGSKYGTHMEEKLAVKTNALEILEKQLSLRARKKQHGVIIVSSATEPYLQFERELKLTRGALELISKYRFPVHLLTRSDLVERDFDLLQEIDQTALLPEDLKSKTKRGAFITFSFSSLHDPTAKIFEPGATPPSIRLQVVSKTLQAGFHSGISFMPMIPYITDTSENLHEAFSIFKKLQVKYLFGAGLTLFGNETSSSRTLVFRAIQKHFPELQEKYQRLLGHSDYLPAYYQEAFNRKMKELSDTYQIPSFIC